MESTCNLCGMEEENSHHAVVNCQKANELRNAMREHWDLPREKQFAYNGPDWLLLLLDRCHIEQRELVLLLLWRAWTLHNNIVHQSGPVTVLESVHILISYQASLTKIRQQAELEDRKGKKPMSIATASMLSNQRKPKNFAGSTWSPPPQGWIKINVDASFVAESGAARAGIIARDCTGTVKFTAWCALFRCAGAAEAEASAFLEGIRLATQWCREPVFIESDCARVVNAFQNKKMDKSEIGFIVAEGKELSRLLGEWKIVQVKRACNQVANELAALARRNTHSAVWLEQAPACVFDLINNDCINFSV